jgi:hypothetical protein
MGKDPLLSSFFELERGVKKFNWSNGSCWSKAIAPRQWDIKRGKIY